MVFAGINYIAVVAAAVAGFVSGAVWYGALGKSWMAEVGLTEEQIKSSQSPLPFVIAGIANLVIATMLAGFLGHFGEVSIYNGVVAGISMWFGFVVTTLCVNYAFSGRSLKLALIDLGHWLLVFVISGAVLGIIGM